MIVNLLFLFGLSVCSYGQTNMESIAQTGSKEEVNDTLIFKKIFNLQMTKEDGIAKIYLISILWQNTL